MLFSNPSNFGRLLSIIFFAFSIALVSNETYARDRQPYETRAYIDWTDADWENWWANIENLYLSGLENEGLYWLLRHDLELLGQHEEILAEIEIPAPYSGWSGGGADPSPPVYIPYSSGGAARKNISDYEPMYGQMPEEWDQLIIDHGLDPADFQTGYSIPPPPMWVAASMVAMGGILSDVPHPGTRIVGTVMSRGGAVIIVWIILEEEEGDEENE